MKYNEHKVVRYIYCFKFLMNSLSSEFSLNFLINFFAAASVLVLWRRTRKMLYLVRSWWSDSKQRRRP